MFNPAVFPREVAFTETGRALVWDAFCGKVYQVDVTLQSQLLSDTVSVSGDGGGFFQNHNSFVYSAVRGLAYAAPPEVTANNNGNPVPVSLSKGAVSFEAALGATTVTFSAQDAAGNVGSVTTTVTLAK